MKHCAIALFCDDIREEKDGRDIIVGIFPDNVNITTVPGTIERICLYTRINLDAPTEPKTISIQINDPNDAEMMKMEVDSEIIADALSKAHGGKPIAGIISRMKGSRFPVQIEGLHKVIVTIDGESLVAGLLNIRALRKEEPHPTS